MSGFLFKSHNCREGDTWGGLLQGIGGDPGECQVWPFDPRPLHCGDQLLTNVLQGLTPFEHPLQHGPIMGTASNGYIMITISMLTQHTQLRSPGEKSMTIPTSCNVLVTYRLNPRHLGSHAQLGSTQRSTTVLCPVAAFICFSLSP